MNLSFEILDKILDRKIELKDDSDITIYGDEEDAEKWDKWLGGLSAKIDINTVDILTYGGFKINLVIIRDNYK